MHFTSRRTFRDARMLMTAAMAFFSLALSLSLLGVRLDTLHMADLKPSALQTTIARQFYGAKKQIVSSYENIRLVYEVESKMRELRRDAETEQPAQPRADAAGGTGDEDRLHGVLPLSILDQRRG